MARAQISGALLAAAILTLGLFGFAPAMVHSATTPYIGRSASVSCVYTVVPCDPTVSVSLQVTQGDTILVWASYYPHCNSPEAGVPSDSADDAYTVIANNGFQFAACIPPGTLALDYQGAYYSTAKATGQINISISYSTAPYESDLVVDDIVGGAYGTYQLALCNGSEASPCMSGAGTFGVPQFSPWPGSLIVAYGSASSYSTAFENPLSPGPGYATDQGPVYPGGYMLDSLTEYSIANGPTTAPMNTSGPADGWGEIAVDLLPSPTVVTQTVTETQTATRMQTVILTSVSTATTTVTYHPPEMVPGVSNDTLILAVALILAAVIISAGFARFSTKRA